MTSANCRTNNTLKEYAKRGMYLRHSLLILHDYIIPYHIISIISYHIFKTILQLSLSSFFWALPRFKRRFLEQKFDWSMIWAILSLVQLRQKWENISTNFFWGAGTGGLKILLQDWMLAKKVHLKDCQHCQAAMALQVVRSQQAVPAVAWRQKTSNMLHGPQAARHRPAGTHVPLVRKLIPLLFSSLSHSKSTDKTADNNQNLLVLGICSLLRTGLPWEAFFC